MNEFAKRKVKCKKEVTSQNLMKPALRKRRIMQRYSEGGDAIR
jgi:hypothetical protein